MPGWHCTAWCTCMCVSVMHLVCYASLDGFANVLPVIVCDALPNDVCMLALKPNCRPVNSWDV
jgi:hypothetical protein